MKISVVIAAYDEVANVEPLTRRLQATLAALPDCVWEAVFVVEGTDGTKQAVERLAREMPQVRLLYEPRRQGLGAAFRRGFAAVSPDSDFVVTLDADLNHQPEEIPRLVAALERRGCDIAIGSRRVPGGRVDGIPLWKRSLSSLVNGTLSRLHGLPDVRDKTSGFRVYRAAALARLDFHNDEFAFLPEILIAAHRLGLTLCEEPIHFTPRGSGHSKMEVVPTSRSYLHLLSTHLEPWAVATLLLLIAGILVRLGVAFPSHRYPADADCALNALCAFKFLSGHTPVFFSGVRIGSLGSLLTAVLFALFGASRTSLAIGPVIVGCLTMLVWYGLCREVLGARGALFALPFLALPNPAFTFWTYMPNGYPETLFFCAAILWLAMRVDRGGGSGTRLAFGLVVGLGVWQSLQTLGCSAPALLWLLLRRPGLLRQRTFLFLAPAGFLLGALPWIVFNVHHPLGSFHGNFAARPAHGVAAVLDNVRFLLTDNLPEALASDEPLGHPPGAPRVVDRFRFVVLCLTVGALGLFFLAPAWLRRRAASRPEADWMRGGARSLFALVFLTFIALNALSEAGMGREVTVRYVLPVFLMVPVLLAVPLRAAAARSRTAATFAAAATLLILAFNLRQTYLPWTSAHREWVHGKATDEQLLTLLRHHRVTAVVGDYWQVYPVNFLSSTEIRGVPTDPANDVWHVADELPAAPLRWALLDSNAAALSAWARRAGLPGTALQIAAGRAVFLPAGGPDPGTVPNAFMARLRAVARRPAEIKAADAQARPQRLAAAALH